MIAKHSTLTLNPSSRKSRTKRRKPKYLRLQLIATTTPPPMPTATTTTQPHDHKQLINLFPLHPENLVEQDKLDEEHNMACIFSSCDDDRAATTLTGILCSDDEDEEVVEEENTNNTNNNNNPSPSSVNYADEEVELVRTAMRRNKTERDRHDLEKWVSYSEVVERKKVMMIRGMSSSSSSSTSCNHNNHRSKLVLKLDYGKVMDSWVNKGPLYIHQNSDPATQPQIVPDLQDDDFFFPSSTAPLNDITHDRDNGGSGGSWTVPEIIHVENTDMGGGEDALQMVGSNAMIQHREASVQRYKEKRRNRLFAKTIRYEVRKLNAQKRPRIKGRFVKRN